MNLVLIVVWKLPAGQIRPTYSIGLSFFHTQVPSSESINAIGFSTRFQPNKKLGFDFSYLVSEKKIENNQKSPKFPNTKETEVFRLGLPFTLLSQKANENDSLNIIPEIIKIKTKFVNKDESSSSVKKIKFPEMSKTHDGLGLSLEYRIFTEPNEASKAVYGVSLRTGAHKYKGQNNIKSKSILSAGLELIIGF